MKRNLLLSSILIGLLVFTYYSTEKLNLEKEEKLKEKMGILSLGNIKQMGHFLKLKAPLWEMVKKNKSDTDLKVNQIDESENVEVFEIVGLEKTSQAKANMAIDIISGLEMLESIPQNRELEKDFFPDDMANNCLSFIFEKGDIKFCVGAKIKFNRNFYAKIKRQGQEIWAILRDPSSNEFVFPEEEEHNSSEKYDRLLAILKLDKEFFKDELSQ